RLQEQRETRKMAVRLASYLVHRQHRASAPPFGPAHREAEALARDYAAEGGFVDWARQRLRAPLPFGPELNQAIHGILHVADEIRQQDDRRFATGLVQWIEAGRPSREVTPIDQVTRQFVAELLSGHRN